MTISEGVPASITTPDTVKTRLGTLEFRDGAPTPETAERLYHHLPPRHPREPLLVGDGLRPPDPLGTADLPAVPQPGQPNGHRRTEPRWLHRPVLRPPGTARKTAQLDPDHPGRGWFPILRISSSLQPFFDTSWRPSETEPQNLSSD